MSWSMHIVHFTQSAAAGYGDSAQRLDRSAIRVADERGGKVIREIIPIKLPRHTACPVGMTQERGQGRITHRSSIPVHQA